MNVVTDMRCEQHVAILKPQTVDLVGKSPEAVIRVDSFECKAFVGFRFTSNDHVRKLL